jgi:hypothetical protein
MKILLSIFALLFAFSASAQFAVTTDTNGLLNAAANGRSTNFFKTNIVRLERAARSFTFNNQTHTNALLQNSVADGLVVTNLSAPGASADTLQIGSSALASNQYAMAVGNGALATNTSAIAFGRDTVAAGSGASAIGNSSLAMADNTLAVGGGAEAWHLRGVAIGPAAVSDHTQSVAIGWASLTTAANQIMLGTSSETVVVPGGINVANWTGSNYVSGRFAYKAGSVTSLVNGNNAGIALGTNQVVELSGGTTIAQIAGFAATGDGDERLIRFSGAVTNWIVNEANSAFSTDATAANRIVTGTGGDITLTNQPAWARIRYRGTSSRWELMHWSR